MRWPFISYLGFFDLKCYFLYYWIYYYDSFEFLRFINSLYYFDSIGSGVGYHHIDQY